MTERLSDNGVPKKSKSVRTLTELDPAVLLSEFFNEAIASLHPEVIDLIRTVFNHFAAPFTSDSTVKFCSKTQSSTVLGVAFEQIPDLLNALGCSSRNVVKEDIFARLAVTALPSRGQESDAEPLGSESATYKEGLPHIPFVEFEHVVALVWYFLVEEEVSDNDIRSAFMTFDIDGDGTLRADELTRVTSALGDTSSVSAEELLSIFARVDADASGSINLTEFVKFFNHQELQKALSPLIAMTPRHLHQLEGRDSCDTLLEVDTQSGDEVEDEGSSVSRIVPSNPGNSKRAGRAAQ